MATRSRKPSAGRTGAAHRKAGAKRKTAQRSPTPSRKAASVQRVVRKPVRIATFLAQHAKDAPFIQKGLRSFFEYRDLGLTDATGGRYGGFVVRATRLGNESTGCHFHLPDAQIIYILM
jgi:hypothetical protein